MSTIEQPVEIEARFRELIESRGAETGG